MRIAIDARELRGQTTGVGRFVHEVLASWNASPDIAAHNLILCANGPVDGSQYPQLNPATLTRGGHGTQWEQLTLPAMLRECEADVLFAPAYTAPLRSPVPVVLGLYDVSFAAHPEWFSWSEGARLRTIVRLAARRAARVLTTSQFSKREIASYIGLESEKIAVVHPGVTRIATPRPIDPAAQPSDYPPTHLPSDPATNLALYVGSIFQRRHVPELVEGFGRLARTHPDVQLQIVGDNRTSPRLDLRRLVHATGVSERIHVRSYLADDELATLYGRARAFAFLSEYEGFGLTPLEALGAGVPIVVLDTPIAREVYGAAAVYVSKPEPPLIQAALERLLFDEAQRARVLEAAPDVLARYSWRDCAAQVLAEIVRAGRS